jgi:SAM-dependent methyltransferase
VSAPEAGSADDTLSRDAGTSADAQGGYWYRALVGEEMEEGGRHSLPGGPYVLSNGILRQEAVHSPDQAQTQTAFGYKWARRDTYESEALQSFSRQWLVDRYLGGRPERLERYFPDGARVLDAGCGSGYSALALLGDRLPRVRYLGVDISGAVDVARERFRERGAPGEFIQADFTRLPFTGPTFDAIFAEGTLHHTDSTRGALQSLAPLLAPGGYLMFYVYRRKGPVREFTDDFVRERLRALDEDEAWDALMPLTRLGEHLGRLGVTVDVPQDIPLLGIPAGPIDLQRFFYWHVFKAFYRPDLSLDEMNHVNFDWYRPRNAHRQSPDEVREWCGALGLAIEHMEVQDAGITVVAARP